MAVNRGGAVAPEVWLEARPTKWGADRGRHLVMYSHRKRTGAGIAPLQPLCGQLKGFHGEDCHWLSDWYRDLSVLLPYFMA